MYISGSNISMSSSESFLSKSKEKITSTIGNDIQVSEHSYTHSVSRQSNSLKMFSDSLKSELIDSSTDTFEQSMLGLKSTPNKVLVNQNYINSSLNDIRFQSLIYILRFLYNRLWRNNDDDFLNHLNSAINSQTSLDNNNNVIGKREIYYEYSENEQLDFSTVGSVVTSDGRQIDFNLNLTLSREFSDSYLSEEDILAINNVNTCDPLVINLDGTVAGVSDQKFYFDVDNDGILDKISSLNSSSGYLALDINGDNSINNGSELFGTKSGNGFYDLSLYDDDGNGWIDEADEVFSKLLIWSKDEYGNDILYHLKDKGIGAICLQNCDSNFSLKNDSTNMTNAIIRHTGMFLYEDGNVGTVQQIDLAT